MCFNFYGFKSYTVVGDDSTDWGVDVDKSPVYDTTPVLTGLVLGVFSIRSWSLKDSVQVETSLVPVSELMYIPK